MSNLAIAAEGLSKMYRIGAAVDQYDTLRDRIAGMAKKSVQWWKSRGSGHAGEERPEIFWALDDVDFSVRPGEVVGVVGRNGAGKSTLLKLLSRITPPTKGRAIIDGRVGSLLEVGTGFHAELTGRENIFLNGAILGMSRKEIQRKLDAIVAFSEIEKFIDTPVKRYSTGMYMRLAFAVAAHLDPEILLVDEVLAVGDAGFQRKCLGKMDEVAKEGRTVLFVSHNMSAIQALCQRLLVLEQGRVKGMCDVVEGVQLYYKSLQNSDVVRDSDTEVAIGTVRVNGQENGSVDATKSVEFRFEVNVRKEFEGFRLFLLVETSQGLIALHAAADGESLPDLRRRGLHRVKLTTPPLWLTSGAYSIHAKIICSGVNLQGRYVGDRTLMAVTTGYDPGMAAGLMTPPLDWEAELVEDLV